MELLFKLLLLPLAHWLLKVYMDRFRSNIKTGDVVGVLVGPDKVVNRTVYIRLENSFIALDYNAKTYIEYPLHKAYTRDYKTLTDISANLVQDS